jgi:hypothetical protein
MSRVLAIAGCALLACTPAATADWLVQTRVRVPNPCWKLRIRDAYRGQSEVLIVSELEPPASGVFCAQVIAEAADAVRIPVPPGALRNLVLGRVWRADLGRGEGATPGEVVWIADEEALERELRGAKRISFERASP